MIKTICFDIDNVICSTRRNFYKKSTPKKKNINLINKLYDNGYFIKIFTARGMGTFNEKINLAKKEHKKNTIKQLNKWGLKYHKLYFGKPSFDLYIDDKNLGFTSNWRKLLKYKLLIK